jgi:hypothetical protein
MKAKTKAGRKDARAAGKTAKESTPNGGCIDEVIRIAGTVAARSMDLTWREFSREMLIQGIVAAIIDARAEGRSTFPAKPREEAALKGLGLDLKELRKAAAKANEIAIEGILTDAL